MPSVVTLINNQVQKKDIKYLNCTFWFCKFLLFSQFTITVPFSKHSCQKGSLTYSNKLF